ncbi:hypothetical protein CC1G_15565 [Coprinopsis cinerea okayama7|uniref:Uncharacterized protein n=1 Tax=Coprinopsis cinerea (strain Okayama-7 / 130 / ATCC MYA-4618 / FGSC 9003) TaxID=240176 RepID=D6RN67_COPC7|nr:hypothetical protein CC1G_15565 [Coprinopsis cinerea okayama7\|eukprot:XP_002911022.1 hypothetical protein CC1G_15565 [Coprinopsis cinerea okayama7\
MSTPSESPSFLSEAGALIGLSLDDHLSLLNYLSSRLRACGVAWNERYPALTVEKRRAFINQFADDLHSAMMLFSSLALRFNHHVSRPNALTKLTKVALSLHLTVPSIVAEAVSVEQEVSDPILPDYVDDWWNQDSPKTLSLPQLVAAWRAQKEQLDAAVQKSTSLSLEALKIDLSGKLDQQLDQANAITEKSLALIDNDLKLAQASLDSIQSAIQETKQAYEKFVGPRSMPHRAQGKGEIAQM